LQCNIAIPGLAVLLHEEPADVLITLGSLPDWSRSVPRSDWRNLYEGVDRDASDRPALTIFAFDDSPARRLEFIDGATFVVDATGATIWADWTSPLSVDDVAVYLLGPVLGFALRSRGTICLHASAFITAGMAVALVGPGGAGKSTTVAALALRGAPVLSDDIVTLQPDQGDFLVQPAYPHVKLWPESGAMLFGATDALPELAAGWPKQRLDLPSRNLHYAAAPAPLGAIYLLDPGSASPDAPVISALGPSDALLSLVTHSYAGGTLDRAARGREFALLSRVVRSVPVRRAQPCAGLACLDALCTMLLEDASALARTARP